ncbi:helix-turn-helix transcriptional regulator [Methylobacterium sp. D54C]
MFHRHRIANMERVDVPNSLNTGVEAQPSHRTWDVLGRIETAADAGEIKSILLQMASHHGLCSLFAGWVPSTAQPLNRAEVVASIVHDHEPSEWTAHYVEQGYVSRDPIVWRLQSECAPFTWQDAYATCPPQIDAAVIAGEAASFGLRDGIVIPVTFLGNVSLAFSFGGSEMDPHPEARANLSFATNFAAGHLLSFMRRGMATPPRELSPRERECLSWAAEGKTDWEIGVITNVSRATVSKHLASAREKLGAVSKYHAIAVAFRSKVLR